MNHSFRKTLTKTNTETTCHDMIYELFWRLPAYQHVRTFMTLSQNLNMSSVHKKYMRY